MPPVRNPSKLPLDIRTPNPYNPPMTYHTLEMTSFALGILLPFALYGLCTVWSNHRIAKGKRKPTP